MEMEMEMTRLKQLQELARNSALEALDQCDAPRFKSRDHAIDEYDENMHEAIAELFPDWTPSDVYAAEIEFNRIVGR